MCVELEAWAARVGKAKRPDRVLLPQGLVEALRDHAAAALEELYRCGCSGGGPTGVER